jgi:hypothetical protein
LKVGVGEESVDRSRREALRRMKHEDRHMAREKRRQRRCPALRSGGGSGQHERADEAYGDKAQRRIHAPSMSATRRER